MTDFLGTPVYKIDEKGIYSWLFALQHDDGEDYFAVPVGVALRRDPEGSSLHVGYAMLGLQLGAKQAKKLLALPTAHNHMESLPICFASGGNQFVYRPINATGFKVDSNTLASYESMHTDIKHKTQRTLLANEVGLAAFNPKMVQGYCWAQPGCGGLKYVEIVKRDDTIINHHKRNRQHDRIRTPAHIQNTHFDMLHQKPTEDALNLICAIAKKEQQLCIIRRPPLITADKVSPLWNSSEEEEITVTKKGQLVIPEGRLDSPGLPHEQRCLKNDVKEIRLDVNIKRRFKAPKRIGKSKSADKEKVIMDSKKIAKGIANVISKEMESRLSTNLFDLEERAPICIEQTDTCTSTIMSFAWKNRNYLQSPPLKETVPSSQKTNGVNYSEENDLSSPNCKDEADNLQKTAEGTLTLNTRIRLENRIGTKKITITFKNVANEIAETFSRAFDSNSPKFFVLFGRKKITEVQPSGADKVVSVSGLMLAEYKDSHHFITVTEEHSELKDLLQPTDIHLEGTDTVRVTNPEQFMQAARKLLPDSTRPVQPMKI